MAEGFEGNVREEEYLRAGVVRAFPIETNGGGASRHLSKEKGATFSQLQRVRHDRPAGPKQFSPALERWGIGLENLTKSRDLFSRGSYHPALNALG